jgi:hypothetical protein
MPHAFTGVPACVQIRCEASENYAKIVGGHAPTNGGALEQLRDQGEIDKTLVFHRFRQASCYPNLPPNTNSKSIRRVHRISSFA